MQESIVYGCIKDLVFSQEAQTLERRETNRRVMNSLPSAEDWPLLPREMFSAAPDNVEFGGMHTDIIHFGSSYRAIEHEWNEWIAQFERLLRNMYWVSAIVHLETELNGVHTFIWETDDDFHAPNRGRMALRCEWSHEIAAY